MAVGWSLIVVIVYLSLAHNTITIPGENGDKYGHILAYASVMYWFLQIYECKPSRFLIAAGLIALGVGLEFAQAWTGYRTFDYADMVADCIGIAVGWLISPPRSPHVLERVEKAVV